eukprot:g6592.t1
MNLTMGAYSNSQVNHKLITPGSMKGGFFFAGFLNTLSLIWGSFGAFLLVQQRELPSAAALVGVLVSWNLSQCSYMFYSFEELNDLGKDFDDDSGVNGKLRATIAFAELFQFLGAFCLLGAGALAAQAKDTGSGAFYGGFGVLELARAIATNASGLFYMTFASNGYSAAAPFSSLWEG